MDSDSIGPGRKITVKFPKLSDDDVIVPGTAKLSFKIDLTSTDVDRTIVNNLGRAIIKTIVVKLYSKEIFTLNYADIFYCYTDLWKSTEERESSFEQGIQSEAIAKLRIDAGDKDESNANNNGIAKAYDNKFYIPLDFELISTHMPLHQGSIKEHLEFQIEFNDYNKVIKATGDAAAKYTISEVSLEYEIVSNATLASTIRKNHQGKKVMHFDDIVSYSTKSLDKSDDKWEFKINVSSKSLKAILLLFVDPADGGEAFDRDSEKFYNPKITDINITIGGRRNQLFDSGMKPAHHWQEISKYFIAGSETTVDAQGRGKKLTDMTPGDYFNDKYALLLHLRSTDDESLHGSGRDTNGQNNEIQLLIKKESETAGNLDVYIYYIQDAQVNFESERFAGKTS